MRGGGMRRGEAVTQQLVRADDKRQRPDNRRGHRQTGDGAC
jgi:hypothetical protein